MCHGYASLRSPKARRSSSEGNDARVASNQPVHVLHTEGWRSPITTKPTSKAAMELRVLPRFVKIAVTKTASSPAYAKVITLSAKSISVSPLARRQ